jgi:hypothetical protein
MKAALEAWVPAAMSATKERPGRVTIRASSRPRWPGIILKPPVGSTGPFREHAELPDNLSAAENRRKTCASRKAGNLSRKSCERQQEKEEAARVPAAAFRAEIEAIEKRSETKTPRGKGGGAKAACAIGPPAKWAPPNDAPPK